MKSAVGATASEYFCGDVRIWLSFESNL